MSKIPIWLILLVGLFLISFACGSTSDDRQDIKSRYGPPDQIETRGEDPFWREIWFYYDMQLAFEFHRSAPQCGGKRRVYLYRTYYIGSDQLLKPRD